MKRVYQKYVSSPWNISIRLNYYEVFIQILWVIFIYIFNERYIKVTCIHSNFCWNQNLFWNFIWKFKHIILWIFYLKFYNLNSSFFFIIFIFKFFKKMNLWIIYLYSVEHNVIWIFLNLRYKIQKHSMNFFEYLCLSILNENFSPNQIFF